MKKNISFFILILLLQNYCNAQKNYKFGLKFGANYMSPNFDNYEPNVAYQGGVYSNINVYKKLVSAQIEFLLTKNKFDVVYNGSNDNVDVSYLNIPLFLKINVWKPFSIYAGNQVGLRANYNVLLMNLYNINQ